MILFLYIYPQFATFKLELFIFIIILILYNKNKKGKYDFKKRPKKQFRIF
jgi:cbb3-type cytochrome oxidase subunit 3